MAGSTAGSLAGSRRSGKPYLRDGGHRRGVGHGLFVRKELRNNGVVKNMREHSQELEAESAPGFPVPATSAEVLLDGHRATRDRVARSILDHGPSSAADLASRLGLTSAAVRRHLDGLAATGLVESREQRVYGSRGAAAPPRCSP